MTPMVPQYQAMVPPLQFAPVTELLEIMEERNLKRKRAVTAVAILHMTMEHPQYPTILHPTLPQFPHITLPVPTEERLGAIIRIRRRTHAPHSIIGYKFLNNPTLPITIHSSTNCHKIVTLSISQSKRWNTLACSSFPTVNATRKQSRPGRLNFQMFSILFMCDLLKSTLNFWEIIFVILQEFFPLFFLWVFLLFYLHQLPFELHRIKSFYFLCNIMENYFNIRKIHV